MDARVPPYSKDAETACLGSVLLNNRALAVVRNVIAGPEDFYVESNRRIYSAMLKLVESGSAVDAVTLGNMLTSTGDLAKIGGAMRLGELTNDVVTVVNVDHYARIVRDKAALRRMIYAAQQVVADGFSDPEDVRSYLAAARKGITVASAVEGADGPVLVGDELSPLFDELESGKMPAGLVRTGIGHIDELTGGLWPELVTVIGGRPGMGKSALCLNIATNAALAGRPTLYIPTEDARRYVVLRQLARFADVDLNDLMLRSVHQEDWPKLIRGANQIKELPLWVDDTPGLSSERIGQVAALHKQTHGLDLLLVDHLGELTDKGESATAAIESAAKGMRNIAKELGIPVVLATQLNREVEHRRDKRPSLQDLRQSGAIEQIARIVWFMYRRGYYQQGCEDDPDTQLIVAKATHGKTGTIRLWSDLSRMFIRGWEIENDGPFPDERSGKYAAPKHAMAPPKEAAAGGQAGFFDNTGAPSGVSQRRGHWTDDY